MLVCGSAAAQNNSLTVVVKGVKDAKGRIAVALFSNEKDFMKNRLMGQVTEARPGEVEVVFEKEYNATPLVNISITLDNSVDEKASQPAQLLQEASQSALEKQVLEGDIRYIVTRRTNKGFTVKLNKPAPSDLQFSWSVLAVKDVKTVISQNTLGVQSASPSASPAPIPIASASAQVKPLVIKINNNELGFLRVREEATTTSNEVAQVLPGQTFQVLVEKNGWYEIEFKTDFYGWVSKPYVSAISE